MEGEVSIIEREEEMTKIRAEIEKEVKRKVTEPKEELVTWGSSAMTDWSSRWNKGATRTYTIKDIIEEKKELDYRDWETDRKSVV